MSIKIAHISDLHWKSLIRHTEYKRAFKILFDELKNDIKPDIIVNTGDSYHLKTANLTNEVYQCLTWMFRSLVEIAPTINILGNHDLSLTNKNRQDTITPIIEALDNKNLFLYKNSGTYKHIINGMNISFGVYSLYDKNNWDKVVIDKDSDLNIALFHGSVRGSKTDMNWVLRDNDVDVSFFKRHDFTLLGDIHKQQYLDVRTDKNGILKPYIGYPGSLIQQNHGEQIKKGYLIWNIRDKNDWDVEFKKLINLAPYITLQWNNSVEQTLNKFEELHGAYAYMPDSKYRINTNVLIPQIQVKRLTDILKDKKASEVVINPVYSNNMNTINTCGVQLNKKSLVEDKDAITTLYRKYLKAHLDVFDFNNEELNYADEIIKNYLQQIVVKRNENSEARNVIWSIKELKFDNLFCYGENNIIKFENFDNITGILGDNALGKSAVIACLMYVLFNSTDRGSIKNALIINRNKNHCYGSIRINVNGQDYVIERRSNKSANKKSVDDDKSNTTVNLWLVENRDGQEVKISKNGISRDDTDKNIRNLIGTSEDFLLTALASQNNVNRFIENKATKRKEILNRFLDLDAFDNIFEYAKNDYSTLDNQSKNIVSSKELIRLIEKTEKEIEKITNDISSFNNKSSSLNEEKDKLNFWIKTHENKAESFNFDNLKDLQNKVSGTQNSISRLEQEIETNKKLLKQKEESLNATKKLISKIDIEELRKEESVFEELTNIINSLQKSYEVQNVELKSQQKSIVKLKTIPCGDSFPNCHYIKDAHEAKQTISQQESIVKDLTDQLNKNKKLYEKYISKNIKKQISDFNIVTSNVTLYESEYDKVTHILENKTLTLETHKKDLKQHNEEIKVFQSSKEMIDSKEFKNKKELLNKTLNDIKDIQNKNNDLLILLGAKKDSLTKYNNEQELNKGLLNKLKIFDSIQTAFSKTGIPVMVLMNQLPDINREIAKVLNGLINFKITLETDTTANILDIFLEDQKGKRPIELGSGMEKTICSLAIRVALGNLSSLPRPDILILDESFGALDEDNLQKALDLLTLFKSFFKSVIVISHIPQIKEIVDMIIEIKSDGKYSTIEMS